MLYKRIVVLFLLACLSESALAQDADPRAAVVIAPGQPVFRLGDGATPRGYAVRLVIDPSRTEFDGEIRIDLRINRPQKTLWLNGAGLTVRAASIEIAGERIELASIAGGDDFIGFTTSQPLPVGEAKLSVRYQGKIEGVDTRGLFRQEEGGEWYVVSQFEATNARRAFPCFDEPGWKTPWQLTLDVPRAQVTSSNTPVEKETQLSGGMKRVRFARTAPLPSYLIALAVGPFDVVDGGVAGKNKTPLRYFTPRGRSAEARYAKQVTPRLLELLEDYFGTPYPFEKLDSVSIPQTVGFGAMENVGMITYASRLLLAKPYEETENFQRRYVSIAAHEIAHQWFGNLVTLAWWDDIWLNESFATWLAQKTLVRFEPRWDNGWYSAYTRSRAITLDRLMATRRVRNPVVAQGDIINAFDAISYEKGGHVLSMFEAALTPERFRDGVRLFMQRHRFGSATAEDFVAALAEASQGQADTVTAFRAFVEQPGTPLVDVELDCTASRPVLKLNQSRLKPLGSQASDNQQWLTPACFQYQEQVKQHNMLHSKISRVCGAIPNGASQLALSEAKICPIWVMGNAEGTGYYVTRYSQALLAKLNARAHSLPAHESNALVSDAALMLESGLLSLDAALAIAEQFVNHPAPAVRHTVVDLLRGLRHDWLDEVGRKRYERIMQKHIVPQALRLGWVEKPGEPSGTRDLRSALLPLAADRGASAALRKEAATLAQKWLVKRDAVPGAIAEAALNSAGTFADATLFSAMESAAFSAKQPADRTLLLTALLKTRAPELRERALSLSLNDKVTGRDAHQAFRSALEDDVNRFAALAYWRDHFDALRAKLPDETTPSMIVYSGRLCRIEERDAFMSFLSERSNEFPGGKQRYEQTLERINLCIAARPRNAPQ